MAGREVIFEPGKKYVFDIKLYESAQLLPMVCRWPSVCEGKLVRVCRDGSGFIGQYQIMPRWCREVPND